MYFIFFVFVYYSFYFHHLKPQDYRLSKHLTQQLVGSFELKKIRKNPPLSFSTDHQTDGLLRVSVFDLRLMLVRRLDREDVSLYNLTVEAVDGGEMVGAVSVVIKVKDVNDNSPVFDRSSYEVDIRENIPVDSTVLVVKATDADDDINAKIRYELEINQDLKNNEENQKEFSKRYIRKSIIDVPGKGDINEFNRNQFKKSSQNSKKRVISDENDEIPFKINNETGRVYTSAFIDYEKRFIYKLIVVARDLGPNSIPARVPLTISVLDDNDNSPEISINTLSTRESVAEVAENMRSGTFVAHLSVFDADSGLSF